MKATRAVALFAILLVCTTCGGTEDDGPAFTDRDARFDVAIGETIEIMLESNVTTGYGWALAADLQSDVLQLVDQRYVAPDSDLVGAGGHEILTFRALGNGSTFIQLWYVRPFDDPPDPADRAQFEVIVGTGVPAQSIDPSEIDEPASTIPDDENALSVPDIVGVDGPVLVRGLLFQDATGMSLCEVLMESYPPQCGGAQVSILNPDVADADFTQEGDIRWTDRAVVLLGEMADGVLTISGSG